MDKDLEPVVKSMWDSNLKIVDTVKYEVPSMFDILFGSTVVPEYKLEVFDGNIIDSTCEVLDAYIDNDAYL